MGSVRRGVSGTVIPDHYVLGSDGAVRKRTRPSADLLRLPDPVLTGLAALGRSVAAHFRPAEGPDAGRDPPPFQRAAAGVVDSDGLGSHAAIVAREDGIPAVMGTATGPPY